MLINLLLAVPFNDDYKKIPEIKRQLTLSEFFEECFLKPAEDEYLEVCLSSSDAQNEIVSFDQEILKEDIQRNLKEQADEMEDLEAWIISQQPDLYCFLGDAGAGKSTFLHYLKYKYESENIIFDIIDIQKATEEIKILNRVIKVPEFHSLYAKSVAALIKHIVDSLFVYNGDVIDTEASVCAIYKVKKEFNDAFGNKFPRYEIEEFFNFSYVEENSFQICKEIANYLYNYLIGLFDSIEIKEVFSIVMEIYVYFLLCKDKKCHHIVAFDNFERFIGVQEIYNKQLTEFVIALRSIQNNITNNNKHLLYKYQLIICMRHTSIRMFTSEQVTEFMPHKVDINQWFEPSSVIKKKINWLGNHGFDIEGIKHIPAILEDMGECGNSLRGLHFKISMLFNYNKRIIVTFLINVLRPGNLIRHQAKYIEKYDYFWNHDSRLPKSLSKFAARSIIYRMLLDRLRDDDFFRYIMVQEEKEKGSRKVEERRINSSRNRLGFARKILTILFNYDCTHRRAPYYMKLSDLIIQLFPDNDNPLTMLFDNNNRDILDNVVQILFYMNYYSPKERNWLQFVDIQYDIDDINEASNSVVIDSNFKLMKLICENYDDINLRITNAGKAYLYFVVYHFEYFACRNISSNGYNMPPLLDAIPTIDEINKYIPENLACIRIIKNVQKDALSCIERMNQDGNIIYFINNGRRILHSQRIINSHIGYLDNFVQCIKCFYAEELKQKNDQSKKIMDIIDIIISIRDNYRLDLY